MIMKFCIWRCAYDCVGRVVPSRYMASVKTKTVEDSASVKPSKSNAVREESCLIGNSL